MRAQEGYLLSKGAKKRSQLNARDVAELRQLINDDLKKGTE